VTANQGTDSAPTERQARILSLVVRQYVATAQPVSSGRLVARYDLGVSAATVRNELAALEEIGLLAHPHTSAGRVPTVAGYRYFVEHLMTSADLPDAELRTIRHQFHQAGGDPERWMRLSAAVMARTSGVAGLVAAPRSQPAGARRVELVYLGDGLVQLVALMADGSIRQMRWRPRQAMDQAALDALGRRVNRVLDHGAEPSQALADEVSAVEADGLAALGTLLERARMPSAPRLYHAGLTQILGEPEFSEGEQLRGVVELLEHGQGLERIWDRLPGSGVQVIIGGEPPLEQVPHVTLVLSRFGQGAAPSGVLGVVGPTRLAYERAVPTVGFVARLLNQLWAGQAI
jgi:heat-inducible transcriptional repressor